MPRVNSSEDGLDKKRHSLLIYGNAGDGKTTLAATAADLGDTILIANNSQPNSVRGNKYKHRLVIYDCENLNDTALVLEALVGDRKSAVDTVNNLLKSQGIKIDEFKWVIFDGFTYVQSLFALILQRPDTNKSKPVYKLGGKVNVMYNKLEYDDHDQIKAMTSDIAWTLKSLSQSVIITTYERKYDDGISPMLTGQGKSMVLGSVDSVIACRYRNGKAHAINRGSALLTAYNRSHPSMKDVKKVDDPTIAKLIGGLT